MNAFLDEVVSLEDMRIRVRHQYEWFKSGEWEIDRVQNPYTTLWLVMGGERELRLDEEVYRIRCGDFVVMPPYVSITLRRLKGDTTLFHYYSMGCEWKQDGFDFVKLYRFPDVTHLEPLQFQSLKEAWSSLYRSWESFAETVDEFVSRPRVFNRRREKEIFVSRPRIDLRMDQAESFFRTKQDLFRWLTVLFPLLKNQLSFKTVRMDERVQKVCRVIGERYSAKLTMKELCETVFLSESQLRVLFKKALSTSPMDYLRDVRLKKAKELLILTDEPVSLIANDCGFEEISYFSRIFRKKEKISPKEYRRKNVSHATMLGQ